MSERDQSQAIETAVCPNCNRDTEQIYNNLTISEHITFAIEGEKSQRKIVVEVTLTCSFCDEKYHHRISEISPVF